MTQPNLSPDFLNFIENNDFSERTMVELGSGESTSFFAKHFKKVHSYEDDLEYYNHYKSSMPNNVDYKMFGESIFNNEKFKEQIYNSDLILIDNQAKRITRERFAYYVHENKKPGSIIVLDNGDWNYNAYEFLRSNYYCSDFLRIDKRNKITQTTIFFHPRVKK